MDAKTEPASEPLYNGFTRFELELEDQDLTGSTGCRGNPWYLNHLATQKYFDNPAFIAYLDYLQYFTKPEYIKFLTYPGPTLKSLELVQQETFRKDILGPVTVMRMVEEGLLASVDAKSSADTGPAATTQT